MLKTHTHHTHTIKPMTIALIGAAVIFVITLGIIAYLNVALPAPAAFVSPANSVPQSIAAAPITVNQPVSNSVYISGQTLRARMDDAYEKHQTALAQSLQHILDGRYEHRCCGLPR